MRDRLFVLWIALLGATRVDLLLGEGPLVLTPFLALSPLLLLVEARRRWNEREPSTIPPAVLAWSLAVGILAALLIVTSFFALDAAAAARRVSLLLAQLFFVTLLGTALFTGPQFRTILAQGAYLGVALALLLNVGQALTFVVPSVPSTLFGGAVSLETYGYEGIIPRPSGLGHDPNLGGMTLLVHLAILALFAPPSRLRTAAFVVGGAAVLATLSRSAFLAGSVLVGATLLRPLQLRITPLLAGGVAAAAAAVLALVILVPGVTEVMSEAGRLLSVRLSPEERSGSDHLYLLSRGWETASDDLSTFFLGIGYGNAFLVLQDIFPGNEYGNFHSLYVTFLAETGVFTLTLILAVLGVALFRGEGWRPLIGGLLVYNLFQQSHTEPWFWLVLLAAWMRVSPTSPSELISSSPRRGRAPALALLLPLLLVGCEEILTEPFQYGEVEVEAVRRSGEPVPGVGLTLFTGTRHLGFAVSDAEGKARFAQVPAGIMGVTAAPDSAQYRPLNLSTGYASSFRMEEGESRRVTFTYLKFGPGNLRVEVRDASGAGLDGVSVEVFGPEGLIEARLTPTDGTFTLENLPFGPYGARVIQTRGFTVPGLVTTRDALFVEDGVTEVAAFQISRCRGSIIVTARTPAGAPAERVSFALYDADQVWEEGETGVDGTITWAGTPCGNYGVRLTPESGARAVSPSGGFVDRLDLEHQGVRNAMFTVAPCRATIRAAAREGSGTPVSGARIDLYTSTGVVESQVTGASGEVAFDHIPCGDGYAVRVIAPAGYRTSGAGRGEAYFDGISLATHQETKSFSFVLVRE